MIIDHRPALRTLNMPARKTLQKKGTIAVAVVEATPVVWKGELLRFEWLRNTEWGSYKPAQRSVGCYHFVNMETNEPTAEFAFDHAFGCCYEENDIMYTHGVRGPGGGNVLDVFWSSDLESWQEKEILRLPEDVMVFNTSVCKGPDGYIMAIEIGGKHPWVGVGFTCIFAKSDDLIHWTLLDPKESSYSRDRYTACPVIRWHDGYYYMIYASGHYKGHYGEAYAIAENVLGPYTKYKNNDILTFTASMDGCGDAIFTTSPDGKELFLVYHIHSAVGTVEPRMTCIDRVKFVPDPNGGPDILTVYGPTNTPQPRPSTP